MSSFTRTMQRRHARKLAATPAPADDENVEQPTVTPQQTFALPDGGYGIVHPTKGFRRISASRLAAQGRLAELQAPGNAVQQRLQFGQMIRNLGRSQADQTRIDELLAAPVQTVTRQMRRLARRTGRAVPITIAEAAAQAEVVVEKVKRARKPKVGADDAVPKPARKPRAKKAATVQAAA